MKAGYEENRWRENSAEHLTIRQNDCTDYTASEQGPDVPCLPTSRIGRAGSDLSFALPPSPVADCG